VFWPHKRLFSKLEFEQVDLEVAGVRKLCLVVIVAQAKQPVGVNDGDGNITYPERLETGKHRSTPNQIEAKKATIRSNNFDFMNLLRQFVRDH